jgi:hypothetical protein
MARLLPAYHRFATSSYSMVLTTRTNGPADSISYVPLILFSVHGLPTSVSVFNADIGLTLTPSGRSSSTLEPARALQ